MEQEGLMPGDPGAGTSGRSGWVSEAPNRRRLMSLRTVKRRHDGSNSSNESLMEGVEQMLKRWSANPQKPSRPPGRNG